MESIRKQDKDEDFQAFMTLLKKESIDIQQEIATDIILNISRFVNLNNDNYLNNIEPTPQYKRWYDKTPELHMAIEILMKLDKHQRDEMIASVSDIIFYKKG